MNEQKESSSPLLKLAFALIALGLFAFYLDRKNKSETISTPEGTYTDAVRLYNAGSYDKAFPIVLALAENGHRNAQLLAAEMFERGQGMAKDIPSAAKWYRRAAESGDLTAQLNIATMYEEGNGVPKDNDEAVLWFRKAAEQGDKYALLQARRIQKDLQLKPGPGAAQISPGPQQVPAAISAAPQPQNFVPAQKASPAPAPVPAPVEKKVVKAASPLDTADAKTLYRYGLAYEEGAGVKRDLQTAADCYRKALDKGYAQAGTSLGYMYYSGHGVQQDFKKAAQFYSRAAASGDKYAKTYLAAMYAEGKGVKQDSVKARDLYLSAAQAGVPQAQAAVGMMYYSGSPSQDYSSAIKWFVRAAKQGNTDAQTMLGIAYIEAKGLDREPVPAAKWLMIASSHGGDKAARVLNALKASLSKADLQKAREQADSFKPQPEK